jgi:hypothetical protein
MDHMTSYVFRIFLFKEAPVFAVCIAGLVAGFHLRRQATPASLWVFLACGWQLTVLLVFPVIWWLLCVWGIQKQNVVQWGFALAENVSYTVCILFLILAACAGRRPPNEPHATDPRRRVSSMPDDRGAGG